MILIPVLPQHPLQRTLILACSSENVAWYILGCSNLAQLAQELDKQQGDMGWGAGKGLGWDFSFQDQGDTRSARHLVKDLQRLQVHRPFRPVGAGAVSYTGGLSSCHPQPFVPTHSPWLWEGEKECYFFSSLSLCLFFFLFSSGQVSFWLGFCSQLTTEACTYTQNWQKGGVRAHY